MTARIIATARIFPATRALLERAGPVAHPTDDEPWDNATLRGALAEAAVVVAHHQIHTADEDRAGALEGGARNEIDGAGEGLARRVGRGRVGDLDAGDVVEIEEPDLDRAAGAVVAGRGQADAAEGDGGVGGGRAFDGDPAAVAAALLNLDEMITKN